MGQFQHRGYTEIPTKRRNAAQRPRLAPTPDSEGPVSAKRRDVKRLIVV